MDASIVGMLGTILGVLIAGPVTYYFSRELVNKTHNNAINLIERQEFNKAAADFRAAFVDAIFELRENLKYGSKRAGDIVQQKVVVPHEKAKIMFERFVPISELSSFNAAWEKYRYGERNQTEESKDDPESRKELSRIYLNHIDALLRYAEAKNNT